MDFRALIRAELEKAHTIADAAAKANRGLTADETTKIEAHEAEVTRLKGLLAARDAAQERTTRLALEMRAFDGAPDTQRGQRSSDDPAGGDPAHVEVLGHTEEKGDALGCLVHARFRFGHDQRAAADWARKQYGERSPQARAMQASNFTSGGATIGENFVGSELIELLRATAAVRRAGARTLPLIGGTAILPKITGGATAFWGDEGDNITPSEIATGAVKLVEKKLTALVPFSNDLAKNSNLMTDRLIRDDMVRAAANAEDTAFLKGTGTSNQPKGIYYWVGAAQRAASAGFTLANVRTDIRTLKNLLGNNNAPEVTRAWFMHSRSINFMGWDLVDGNGNFAFPSLQTGDNAALGGGIVRRDNNISIAIGTTNSEIYYAEMTECFIGDNPALEIEVLLNATYVDVNGQLRSGVSRDESVCRLIRKTDFAMRHTVSGAVLETVQYGA